MARTQGKIKMSDAKQIEMYMEDVQKQIDLAESLEALHDNPHFKKVILEGYFKEAAVDAVMNKANPAVVANVNAMANLDNTIQGIAQLYAFFSRINQQAEVAKKALEESQEELQEALEEELV